MVLQTEKRHYTLEEYLEFEEQAEYRSEYLDGEIISVTGATTNHNKISGNFYKKFPEVINNQNYDTYIGDVKVWIPRYSLSTYPDVMIIKGKPVYKGTGTTTITNPSIIVEVLSNSTKNYDRTNKFKYYRSIPEFQEYILIDQYSFSVEQYTKTSSGKWLFEEYEGEDVTLELDSVDFQISLKDIYARVDFDLVEE